MSANGISTLPTKAQRKSAKIALAEAKRQTPGPSWRLYSVYAGTVSPTPHRPWDILAEGGSAFSGNIEGGASGTVVWDYTIDNGFSTTEEFDLLVDGKFAPGISL